MKGSMSDRVITVNGNQYDKHTGLPVKKASSGHVHHPAHHAANVHSKLQRSTTLNRRYIKHPVDNSSENESTARNTVIMPKTKSTTSQSKMHDQVSEAHVITVKTGTTPHVIKHFAKDWHSEQNKPKVIDVGPIVHPMVQQVEASRAVRAISTMPKPSHIIKAEAISAALDKAPSEHQRNRAKVPKSVRTRKRAHALQLAMASVIMLLLGGYFTYINMPNLSTRVAAVRAGIDASYPTYHPTGYSLAGPVAYDSGEVRIKFAANGSTQTYTVEQVKSGWDSSAVYENYIKPRTGDNYTITRDSGLTIYSYDGNAAWVNKGIFYTIEGDATLTNDQIQRIALSM